MAGSGRSKTSMRALNAADRKVRALELRLLGWKQPEIAAELGVSQQAVSKMLTAARAERDTAIAAKAEELRADEIDRLDMLTKKVSAIMEPRPGKRGKMIEPDPHLIIKAGLAIAKFGEARAKLHGLNAKAEVLDEAGIAARAIEKFWGSVHADLAKAGYRGGPDDDGD